MGNIFFTHGQITDKLKMGLSCDSASLYNQNSEIPDFWFLDHRMRVGVDTNNNNIYCCGKGLKKHCPDCATRNKCLEKSIAKLCILFSYIYTLCSFHIVELRILNLRISGTLTFMK